MQSPLLKPIVGFFNLYDSEISSILKFFPTDLFWLCAKKYRIHTENDLVTVYSLPTGEERYCVLEFTLGEKFRNCTGEPLCALHILALEYSRFYEGSYDSMYYKLHKCLLVNVLRDDSVLNLPVIGRSVTPAFKYISGKPRFLLWDVVDMGTLYRFRPSLLDKLRSHIGMSPADVATKKD